MHTHTWCVYMLYEHILSAVCVVLVSCSDLLELLDLRLVKHGKDVGGGSLATLLRVLLPGCSGSTLEGGRRERGRRRRYSTNSKTYPHSGASLYNSSTTVCTGAADRYPTIQQSGRLCTGLPSTDTCLIIHTLVLTVRYFIHYIATLTIMADL